MKKSFILLPLITLLGYTLLTSYQSGPGSPGGIEGTGAFGSPGCNQSGCHSSAAGITLTAELLSGAVPVTTYTPGASYNIRLSATYTSATSVALLPKFGFQISCIKATGPVVNVGMWGALPVTMHTATVAGVNLVEHSSAFTSTTGTGAPGSTTYVVTIPWLAPVAGTGSIKINGIINAVNGNGMQDPVDRWGANNVIITEAAAGPGAITGTLTVCAGDNTTLSCTPAGGTWTSSNTTVGTVGASSGVVTGLAPGTTTIMYTTGAGTPASAVVTVNPTPTPVTGTFTMCVGGAVTLNSTPSGGTWSCSPATVATINPTTGAVSGIGVGTALVAYALGSCSVGVAVTVNSVGAGPISGSNTVCVGLTTTLTNPTSGGSWSSSAPTKATVGTSSGIVTGVAVGTANITYTATNGCGTSFKVHSVNVLSAASCPTGVVPITTLEDALLLYPNPAYGTFNITMQSAIGELAHVTITNIAGEKVKELYMQTNAATEVRIPSVAGIYFVAVTTSQGRYVSKLLIQ